METWRSCTLRCSWMISFDIASQLSVQRFSMSFSSRSLRNAMSFLILLSMNASREAVSSGLASSPPNVSSIRCLSKKYPRKNFTSSFSRRMYGDGAGGGGCLLSLKRSAQRKGMWYTRL